MKVMGSELSVWNGRRRASQLWAKSGPAPQSMRTMILMMDAGRMSAAARRCWDCCCMTKPPQGRVVRVLVTETCDEFRVTAGVVRGYGTGRSIRWYERLGVRVHHFSARNIAWRAATEIARFNTENAEDHRDHRENLAAQRTQRKRKAGQIATTSEHLANRG